MHMNLTRSQKAGIVKAFNRWMDDYIHHPEKYEAEFQTVMEHLKERKKGKEPTYGEGALAMLVQHGASSRTLKGTPQQAGRKAS